MLHIAYSLLVRLLSPLLTIALTLRARKQHDTPGRWRERWGFVAADEHTPGRVWLHAASLGEVRAAAPLVDALLTARGDGAVWLTTMTTTGSQEVQRRWGERVRHSYVPLDTPGSVRRFIARVRPTSCVILETEIWPNLFHCLRRNRIKLVIANARLSDRSMRGYGRVSGSIRRVLQGVTMVAAQSEGDAARFRELGAAEVVVTGNIKYDMPLPADQLALGRQWRQHLGQRPVWAAVSTHDAEETAVLAAHRELQRWYPDSLLVLVPRHPQRFSEVARMLQREGCAFVRRSAWGEQLPEPGDASVLLGDSVGEMFSYLAAADIAFVGGSLVEIGGHNILEPAALGMPVLFGPHMYHFIEARRRLLEAGAAIEISSAQTLAAEIGALLARPEKRSGMGRAAAEVLAANRGTVQRLSALLDRIEHGTSPESTPSD